MMDLSELLPRQGAAVDVEAMRRFIRGKRVLVTGAGGSIGSELCRQIAQLGCATLAMFERHENSLHEVMLSIDSPAAQPFLGDVLDSHRLEETFATVRPQIVFHAAAHKHVPLIERHPAEAVKNNVTGTRLVAEAAEHFDAERLVLISTDKAVNPSSVMGATKRVAELLLRHLAVRSRTELVAVRFGNVLGSSGSVVPRFVAQIAAGGPITVTHPEVRRFFIRTSEAVQLVIEAAALGGSGAMYVLEMGEPIRIVDLARRVLQACGAPSDMPIEFIGLRPGEKLDEELVGTDEVTRPTNLPHVAEIHSDKLVPESFADDLARLEALAYVGSTEEVIAQLRVIVPEFTAAAPVQADA